MIYNIIDRRRRPNRWATINAIVEPTAHDNGLPDADIAAACDDYFAYHQREGISLADAIAWANGIEGPITLYLYDEDDGTIESSSKWKKS